MSARELLGEIAYRLMIVSVVVVVVRSASGAVAQTSMDVAATAHIFRTRHPHKYVHLCCIATLPRTLTRQSTLGITPLPFLLESVLSSPIQGLCVCRSCSTGIHLSAPFDLEYMLAETMPGPAFQVTLPLRTLPRLWLLGSLYIRTLWRCIVMNRAHDPQ